VAYFELCDWVRIISGIISIEKIFSINEFGLHSYLNGILRNIPRSFQKTI